MSIKINFEDEEVYSIEINGEEYFTEGEGTVVVPISAFNGISIKKLPLNVCIEICDACDDNLVVSHNVPTTIMQKAIGEFEVCFDEMNRRKYWNAPVGLKLWMETKRKIAEEKYGLTIENYDDDGDYIYLSYSVNIVASSFEDLFLNVDTIYNELEGATDITLGSPFEKIENCKDEKNFTTKVLLPLFRNLGFINVKYMHGTREYGKDITMARLTEFDEYEFYGVQVKYGDISGGASGTINDMITQIDLAFNMPFDDLYTRQQVRVSKIIVAISGKFTKQAIEQIVNGIADPIKKNNLIFLDGDKITSQIESLRKK